MFRLLPVLLVALAGCDNDPLCESAACVAKNHADCPRKTPIVGANCGFEGDCYYCSPDDPTRAKLFACTGGEYAQEGYGIDTKTCEGRLDTALE
jgi:hypothetical protein